VTLRRRLVVTMVGVVAVGLLAVDVITYTSLHSYLYGRVDSQLTTAAHQVAALEAHASARGRPVNEREIRALVSPDVYVVLLDAHGIPVVVKPSGSSLRADPTPRMPSPLPVRPLPPDADQVTPSHAYRPAPSAVNVGTVSGPRGHRRAASSPRYRLLAVSLPGHTLVVATLLDSVSATLGSLQAIELGLSVGLLVVLAVLITVLVRRGLRPLEDMSRDADAIAAGDLSLRVHPSDGTTEVSRLGRALNGMLAQIETAFAQRTSSEDRLRSFLADASHELRTPLTSIQGYAELLRRDALPDEAARDRALSRIEQEAARMGLLVGDLAILAREGEGPEPERTVVDLAAVAAAVVDDARMIDRTRPIVREDGGPVPVLGDPARLEQLVHNLVQNALTHTPAGTPVEVRVAAVADRAVLTVADHGPGMTPDQVAQAFDRFYRGGGTARDGGSGLGLFIVARLARTFGGSVSVVSAPGEGATFTVELPVHDAGNGVVDARAGDASDRGPDGAVGPDGASASGPARRRPGRVAPAGPVADDREPSGR
jgi:two-component system, OmpR family, sensor kinase